MISPISERKVPFFTPVESEAYPLIKVFDHYFWFGGQVADVAVPEVLEGKSIGARKKQGETNQVATILKIVSMIASLGILPLLALAIKAIIRCSYQFHWIQNAPSVNSRGNRVPPAVLLNDLPPEFHQAGRVGSVVEPTAAELIAIADAADAESIEAVSFPNSVYSTPPRSRNRAQMPQILFAPANDDEALPAHRAVRVRNITSTLMSLPMHAPSPISSSDPLQELDRIEETLNELEHNRNIALVNPVDVTALDQISRLNQQLESLNSLSDKTIITGFSEKRHLNSVANGWPQLDLDDAEFIDHYAANYSISTPFQGLHGRALAEWLVSQQEREASHMNAFQIRDLADQQNREYEEACEMDRLAALGPIALPPAASIEPVEPTAVPDAPTIAAPLPVEEAPRLNPTQAREARAAAAARRLAAVTVPSIAEDVMPGPVESSTGIVKPKSARRLSLTVNKPFKTET